MRRREPQTVQSLQPENLDQAFSDSSTKACLEYAGIKDCRQQVHLLFIFDYYWFVNILDYVLYSIGMSNRFILLTKVVS